MGDALKGRGLLRLSARWPLRIKTGCGGVAGGTRNSSGEGMFLRCPERLCEGILRDMTMELPEKRGEMTGQVSRSNSDTCTSLNVNPEMGFSFMRVDDKDKQNLGAAIPAERGKTPPPKHEADRHADSFLPGEAGAAARIDGIAGDT